MTTTKRQQHFSFGELLPERRREIASMGAKASHATDQPALYSREEAEAAIAEALRTGIPAAGITLYRCTRTCGKADCACHSGGARHGPYWQAIYRDHERRAHSLYLGKQWPPRAETTDADAQAAAIVAMTGMSGRGRGFAGMSPEKRREIARLGGQAVQAQGVAHQWQAGEEARAAGCKGGAISRRGPAKKASVSP